MQKSMQGDLMISIHHDLLDIRLQKYRNNSLCHATIDIYVSDATDNILDSEAAMTLLWCLQLFSIAPFRIQISKIINICLEFYFICYNWYEILEHICRKLTRTDNCWWPLKALFICNTYIMIGNTSSRISYQLRDTLL